MIIYNPSFLARLFVFPRIFFQQVLHVFSELLLKRLPVAISLSTFLFAFFFALPQVHAQQCSTSAAGECQCGSSCECDSCTHHAGHELGGADEAFIHGHLDSVPNFGLEYSAISVANGNWSDPNTWQGRKLPKAGSIVRIAEDTVVTYDEMTVEVDTIGVEGTFRFDPKQDTRLKIANLLVYRGGYLEVGTSSRPIASNVRCEIILANKPLDTVDDGVGVFDPEQWGTALLNFGKIRMFGHELGETFLRLSKEPLKGDTTLVAASSVSEHGWRVGDRLLLPDTMDRRGKSIEELEIEGISGKVITLTSPLKFNHVGARDVAGKLDFLPHVLNMNRNIRIGSEYRDLPTNLRKPVMEGTRGHTVSFGTADVDIRYVSFEDLGRTKNVGLDSTIFEADLFDSENKETYRVEIGGGLVRDPGKELPKGYSALVSHGQILVLDSSRKIASHIAQVGDWRLIKIGTNQIARYALHTHHVSGPRRDAKYTGYQFQLVGNAIDNGGFGKWAMVIHGSHFGLIENNIVYNVQGAGIVTEDGSETKNVFARNFAILTQFHSGSSAQSKHGLSGDGFWFRGNNNYVRGNVSSNNSSFGFTYFNQTPKGNPVTKHGVFTDSNEIRIPRFRGADTSRDDEMEFINGQTQVIAQFEDNEVYAAHTGVNLWTLSMKQRASRARIVDRNKRNLFKDLRLWHLEYNGIFTYGARNITLEDFVFRGNSQNLGNSTKRLSYTGISRGAAIKADGVKVKDNILRNADIQGVYLGIDVGADLGGEGAIAGESGSFIVEDSYIRAHIGIQADLWARDREKESRERNIWIRNTTFDPLVPEGYIYNSKDHESKAIWLNCELYQGSTDSTFLRRDNVYFQDVTVYKGYSQTGKILYNTIKNGQGYYLEQARNYKMPKSYLTKKKATVKSSPESGLTNEENFKKFGICMAGGIAPCQTTLENIDGFICDEMGGNQGPIARVTATVTSGEIPLAVEFTSKDSFDPDGTIASYHWDFGDGTSASGKNASHTYPVAGDYTARLTVTDSKGASAVDPVSILVMPASIVDNDPPSIPVGVNRELVEGNSVRLSWQAVKAEDLGGYFIYRNSTKIKTVTSTSFFDANLVAEGSYSYAVSSFDNSGNESKRSLSVEITLESIDTDAPATPEGVSATLVGDSSIRLTWKANKEGDLAGYYVYRNGRKIKTVTSTSFLDANVAAEGSYSYSVSSFDSSDNASGRSSSVQMTMLTGDTERPRIAGCPEDIVQLNDLGLPSAEVSWLEPTASDNVGVSSFQGSHKPEDVFPLGASIVSYSASDAAKNTTNCSFQVTVDFGLSVAKGWNLLSVPVVPELSAKELLKGYLTGDVWKWEKGKYEAVTELQPTEGYWLYLKKADTIDMVAKAGEELAEEKPELQPGWNLWGPQKRVDNPYNDKIQGSIWYWLDGGYKEVDREEGTLEIGKAYWIRSKTKQSYP